MKLRLLGPTEAILGGRPVALGARKQRALLAMLALDANRTVSTERLAEGLWGEEPPPSASKMVQLYIWQLRRLLDGDGVSIVTHGRGYELRLPADAVDAAQFERLVGESRYREALALWRGDALADVADEPFAAPEIRRLEELRLHAQELAIDAELAAGRQDDVVAELDALAAQHPLRERLQARRMLALYRAGRQSEALHAYRQARTELVEQIGVEPGSELRKLHEAILAQEPGLDLPAARPAEPPPGSPDSAPTAHRRRFVPLLAAALLAATLGLVAFGISRVTAPDQLPRIDENAVGLIEPDSGRITAQYAVGRGPGAMVAGGGSVWVANALADTVSRIDHEREQVVTIDVGGEPTGMALGAGSLWVANGEERTVAQVDPGSNRVVQRLPVGNAPRSLAAGFGALWVASSLDGAVRRIDLDRPRASRSIALGANPTALAAGAGAVWVASEEAGTVSRLDPRTGAVVGAINVGNGPSAVAVGAGAVWAVNRSDGTVSRIDPASNRVDALIRLGGDPSAIAVGDEDAWVAGGSAGTVTQIEAQGPEPRIIKTIEVQNSPTAIAIAGGDVWAAASAPPGSHRGGTLRFYSNNAEDPLLIDWLQPFAYDFRTVQLVSLAYDGLVAYPRVAGAAGTTLVGGLATNVPQPSRDGRTYVFALRPGLRFSDGTAVRPEDFRASMERFLRVAGNQLPPFYAGIVGAERCMSRPHRCDLSAGIETDARARTITVHLTRPDGEFLHKLTFEFAYVVPASTPVRRTRDHAPPGTGPYRFAAWDSKRGGQLVRNPYFRSWSPRARPAGLPDRIEIRHRRGISRNVADVESGAADIVGLANPFRAIFPAKRFGGLTVRAPGRLHSHPEAVVNYMFLNVGRAPFDEIRVRQAVNLATDRSHVVDLEGGRALATPTCQLLPSGFPGYEPYCPYTANPGPGRGWTAPQMERARRLVAESETAGERVGIAVPTFQRDVGRYFAGLLDKLGYRPSLRVIDDREYFGLMFNGRLRTHMGFQGWSADFLTPSTFITPNFGCQRLGSPPASNLSHFCDRDLTRQIDRALAAEGADANKRWAAVDRRLTDLAPFVPLTNRRSVDFVSPRVGDVPHHLQAQTLLEQLWVR